MAGKSISDLITVLGNGETYVKCTHSTKSKWRNPGTNNDVLKFY